MATTPLIENEQIIAKHLPRCFPQASSLQRTRLTSSTPTKSRRPRCGLLQVPVRGGQPGGLHRSHDRKAVKSEAHEGPAEYGAEEETTPTINATVTEPVVTMPTNILVKQLSKVKEIVTNVEEATATAFRKGNAPTSSVISVVGRPSLRPVLA